MRWWYTQNWTRDHCTVHWGGSWGRGVGVVSLHSPAGEQEHWPGCSESTFRLSLQQSTKGPNVTRAKREATVFEDSILSLSHTKYKLTPTHTESQGSQTYTHKHTQILSHAPIHTLGGSCRGLSRGPVCYVPSSASSSSEQ